MNNLLQKGLYAITPSISDTGLLLKKVEQALLGGIVLLQYRDKTSTPKQRLRRAEEIHQLCLRYKVPLIINDDPQLALACNAEGVHLGQDDGSIQHARKLLGANAIIGATCHHHVSLAVLAEEQGANYVAFGRFFKSSTKPGAPLATLQTLAKAKKNLSIPLVAIGGINHDNAKPLVINGADNLAVVDNVFAAADITESCKRFAALF